MIVGAACERNQPAVETRECMLPIKADNPRLTTIACTLLATSLGRSIVSEQASAIEYDDFDRNPQEDTSKSGKLFFASHSSTSELLRLTNWQAHM